MPQIGNLMSMIRAVDPHNNDEASRYAELLGQIFQECRRVLREPQGRLVFTFHHWNPKAWAALTIALKQAGFYLLNQAVVLSENPISVHIAKMNALTHDAILVFAPGSAGRTASGRGRKRLIPTKANCFAPTAPPWSVGCWKAT